MGKVVGGVVLSATGVGSGSSLLSSPSLSGPGWGGRLLACNGGLLVSSDRLLACNGGLLVSSCRLLACNGGLSVSSCGLSVSSCRLLACNGGLLVSSRRLLACNGGLLVSSCRLLAVVKSGKLLVPSGVILVVSGRLLVSNGGLLVSGEERAVGKPCAASSLWSRHRNYSLHMKMFCTGGLLSIMVTKQVMMPTILKHNNWALELLYVHGRPGS